MAQLVKITHTSPEVLSLLKAKKQLRFDDPSAAHPEDDLIEDYIDAAISYAENYTNQEITEKKFKINGSSFADALSFNKQLIQSIDLVEYYDESNVKQTISTENYFLTTVDDYENKIEFSGDFTFPEVKEYRPDAVQISVTVGYASGEVPKGIIQPLKMLVSWYYENREDQVKEKCTAAEVKLHNYRRY